MMCIRPASVLLATVLASVLTTFSGLAGAQSSQSTQPIKLIVPFASGGPTDIAARIIAPRLSASLGRTVVVENKVGASGLLAMRELAKAPPDGYTLSYTNIAIAVSQELLDKGAFSLKRDVTPIGGVAVVSAASPPGRRRTSAPTAAAAPL